jgi:hypothetical protein
MTDPYYAKEDDVVETEETALANWEAAQTSVANFVPEAAEDLNRTEEMLRKLWEEAAKTGNVGSQALIEHLWKIAERSTTRIAQQDAVHQLAKVAYEKNVEHRKQIQEELGEIQSAIEDVEEMGYAESPLLRGVVDVIREQVEEELEEVGFYIEDPGMEAHANGWYDCLVPEAVDAVFYALFGDTANVVPAELREKMAEFVNSFGEEMIGIRKAKRAAFMQALDRRDAHALADLMAEEDLMDALELDVEFAEEDEELLDVDD